MNNDLGEHSFLCDCIECEKLWSDTETLVKALADPRVPASVRRALAGQTSDRIAKRHGLDNKP